MHDNAEIAQLVEHNLAAKEKVSNLGKESKTNRTNHEKNAEIAQLVEHNLAAKEKVSNLGEESKTNRTNHEKKCGNSSVGRAQPCQGWGREFEPRFPLNK